MFSSFSSKCMVNGLVVFCVEHLAAVPCRGVAKLVKAPDFDSGIRRFDSFHPCQIFKLMRIMSFA